jgi:hypothetical protein
MQLGRCGSSHIQIRQWWLWIPGSMLSHRPGMTTVAQLGIGESITTKCSWGDVAPVMIKSGSGGYGFRARCFASPRNDDGDSGANAFAFPGTTTAGLRRTKRLQVVVRSCRISGDSANGEAVVNISRRLEARVRKDYPLQEAEEVISFLLSVSEDLVASRQDGERLQAAAFILLERDASRIPRVKTIMLRDWRDALVWSGLAQPELARPVKPNARPSTLKMAVAHRSVDS